MVCLMKRLCSVPTDTLFLHHFFFSFFFFFFFFGVRVSSQGFVSFSYPNDPTANFFLLGDAVESHGFIQLTSLNTNLDQTLGNAGISSAGRFLCRTPIRMLEPETLRVSSFSTSFTFKINTLNSSYQGGDGLAFVISPDNSTVGGQGEYLGAFLPGNVTSQSHTFAVEFDTFQNDDVGDPNDNHVGIDLTNITSLYYNNASNVGIQLNDGSVITAWIRYDGVRNNLQVRISTDSMEPEDPLIDANLSLSNTFNEFMYVGFSGSTGLSNELHTLMSWAFSSWGVQQEPTGENAPRAKHGSNAVIIPICLALLFLVIAFGLVSWRMTSARRRRMHSVNYFRRAKDEFGKPSSSMCAYPRAFTYKELYGATKGFSEKQRLASENGIGRFFKGVLVDSGIVVALKRIAKDPREGVQEFLQEVSLLISLPHRNLVPIQGWCLDKGELILVYEFMPNESLEKYLFNDQFETLGWSQRYNIVVGIAEGLAHLHEGGAHQVEARKPTLSVKEGIDPCNHVLHRDVKASNVMLDNNFNARLGDYGLGRLVCRNKKESGMVLEGTFGYIAPEVVETGKMTTKADVFSFGIVVLEVACGRRAIEGDEVLVDHVWALHTNGHVLGASDKRLKGCFDVGEMECLLYLGLLCTLADPSLRPSMSHVRSILRAESPLPQLPPCPKQPFRQVSSLNDKSTRNYNDRDEIQGSLQISIDELLSS